MIAFSSLLIFYGNDKENLFDNEELFKLERISFILKPFKFDLRVIL